MVLTLTVDNSLVGASACRGSLCVSIWRDAVNLDSRAAPVGEAGCQQGEQSPCEVPFTGFFISLKLQKQQLIIFMWKSVELFRFVSHYSWVFDVDDIKIPA